ncbi:MAG: redox-regulated ATPase YchF [bacterium]|nr:redox-regulated ATPase YchF [bacterium]
MEAGIVGYPGSGRSTVFNALLAHRAQEAAGARKSGAAIGVIHVQDARLEELSARFKPKKTTPIEIRLHDLCPSLEPNFPTAEIEAMKRMDLLLLVIPAFADPDPAAQLAGLDGLVADLCLEDLAAIEKLIKRTTREKTDATVKEALDLIQTALEASIPVISASSLQAQHREALRGYGLITDRPMIAVANNAEDAAGTPPPAELVKRGEELGIPILALAAGLEAEMAELAAEDRVEFLAEYGVSEPAGAAVTRAILERGDIIPFFTAGEDECRAWAIARNTAAKQAAGKIHSDIERGFIRAEVIGYDEYEPLAGGLTEAKSKGLLRVEGKDYIVQDGDIVNFRHNT